MTNKYRKIALIRPGRIYGQRTNLMGLYSEVGGLETLIFGRNNTSICNLSNFLFFLCFSIKHVFWHFSRRARYEICSKLRTKTSEFVKLTIELKIKTPLASFFIVYFDGLYSGFNRVTYLVGVYSEGGLTGFYGLWYFIPKGFVKELKEKTKTLWSLKPQVCSFNFLSRERIHMFNGV